MMLVAYHIYIVEKGCRDLSRSVELLYNCFDTVDVHAHIISLRNVGAYRPTEIKVAYVKKLKADLNCISRLKHFPQPDGTAYR